MSRLRELDGPSWQEFLTGAPGAVLVLGKSDCENCTRFAEELEAWLADPAVWPEVRFGKLFLDRPGLASFKRANPWLAEVDVLPTTVLYRGGERAKSFAGGGVERLERRLASLFEGDGAAGSDSARKS